MNPSPEDIRIGRMAALDNVKAHLESDIGHFKRDDLTEAQNEQMQAEMAKLYLEFAERKKHLRIYAPRA